VNVYDFLSTMRPEIYLPHDQDYGALQTYDKEVK